MRRGPWNCRNCITAFKQEGRRDLTLDEELLFFLATGNLPANEDSAAQIIRAARFLLLDAEGTLWVFNEGGWRRRMPCLCER